MEFVITNIEYGMDHMPYDLSDPFKPQYKSPCLEMNLKSINITNESMRKITNIYQNVRKVSIQDTDYIDYMEPFKNEFIEFMMEKHPEKIISNLQGWNKLLGRK